MHPVGFFFTLLVGWRDARPQYVFLGITPYSVPAVHCLLVEKKKKKLWAGVGWRKGLYSGGHCISGKFKKDTYQ